MTEPTLQQFYDRLHGEQPRPQRFGQWAFNLLHEMRHDLSEQIRATDLDPFYDNVRMQKFLGWVNTHWEPSPASLIELGELKSENARHHIDFEKIRSLLDEIELQYAWYEGQHGESGAGGILAEIEPKVRAIRNIVG